MYRLCFLNIKNFRDLKNDFSFTALWEEYLFSAICRGFFWGLNQIHFP